MESSVFCGLLFYSLFLTKQTENINKYSFARN